MGINFNLDLTQQPKVVLQVKMMGVYAAGTDYAVGDAVTYNGGVYYMHTDAAAGTAPTDTAAWQAINSPQAYVESINELSLINTTTDNTISVDQNGNVGTDVSTDGAVHIDNTDNTGIGLAVYTNQDATASAPLVHFKADNAAFDQSVCRIDMDGNYTALALYGNKTDGTSQSLVYINDTNTAGGNQTVKIISARGSGVEAVLIDVNSNAWGLRVDHDSAAGNPGASIKIDLDAVGATNPCIGLQIDVDNGGAGAVIGIDLSSFTAGERLLRVPTDNTSVATSTTDSTGRIAVDDGAGNVRYVPYFT